MGRRHRKFKTRTRRDHAAGLTRGARRHFARRRQLARHEAIAARQEMAGAHGLQDTLRILRAIAERGEYIGAFFRVKARKEWIKARSRQDVKSGWCFGCRQSTTHQHHVIPLSRGGDPVQPENRVWLCLDCHAQVHPWMQTEALTRQQQQDYAASKPCWS